MNTVTRRKTSSQETSKVSTPDIENGRTALDDNAKSTSTSSLVKVNIFLFLIAVFLTFLSRSDKEVFTKHYAATNPLFHKYVTTLYGEDKYIRFLDRIGITLADGGKDTIIEVKDETPVTPASDTTPKKEPKVEPEPSPTKIDTNIVKDTINISPFCPDCVFDAATMGKTTCLARAQFFVERYGGTEEEKKNSVMEIQPVNCVNKKAPSGTFCPGCLFNVDTMGKTTCLARAQFFKRRYGGTEEETRKNVMVAEPTNCAI